jgi:hypothetical protein
LFFVPTVFSILHGLHYKPAENGVRS